MSDNSIQKCFVVMPFGKKPKSDGSGEYYDFDKIYRVIIRRAIREANMEGRQYPLQLSRGAFPGLEQLLVGWILIAF